MSSSVETKRPSEYQDNLQVLMEIPFFAGLPLEALKLVAYFCRRETFKSGDFVFQEGEVDGNACYVLSGRGSLTVTEEGMPIPIRSVGEGDFIGGLSLLGDMKRLFSLRAELDMVCIVLTREKFRKTLEQFPQIVHRILEAVVAGVYQWEARILRRHVHSLHGAEDHFGVSLL